MFFVRQSSKTCKAVYTLYCQGHNLFDNLIDKLYRYKLSDHPTQNQISRSPSWIKMLLPPSMKSLQYQHIAHTKPISCPTFFSFFLSFCRVSCPTCKFQKLVLFISSVGYTYQCHWTTSSVGEPGTKGTKPRPPKTGRMKESSNFRQ